jgi:hypothetical protein
VAVPASIRFGRSGLEVVANVDRIIIQGAARTKERYPGRISKVIQSRTAKLMLTAGDIRQPIDVVHVLRKHGMSLRAAHDVITRLAKRQVVAVEIETDDAGRLFSQLADASVNAYPIQGERPAYEILTTAP